jgi:hypothetical protein
LLLCAGRVCESKRLQQLRHTLVQIINIINIIIIKIIIIIIKISGIRENHHSSSFIIIQETLPETTLAIVGGGPSLPRFQKVQRELGLDDMVP